MQLSTARTIARRASRAYDHAVKAYAMAETEAAKRRHARRIRNAERAQREASRDLDYLYSVEA